MSIELSLDIIDFKIVKVERPKMPELIHCCILPKLFAFLSKLPYNMELEL